MFEAVVILCLAAQTLVCEQPREYRFPVVGQVTPYQCMARVMPELAQAYEALGGRYRVGRWTCKPMGKEA